jgi:hypothetical protein
MFTTNGGPGEREFATYSCVEHAKTKFIDLDWCITRYGYKDTVQEKYQSNADYFHDAQVR